MNGPAGTLLAERPAALRARPARAAFDRFEAWMLGVALPCWSTVGLSPDGGVVECLGLDGRPMRPGFKRVRVHARQIYVFSHAHVMGIPGMIEAARAGFDFLRAHGGAQGGGWVVKMGEAGGVVDGECDLYDQAFVILALAWFHRATGEAEPLALARATLAAIETRFARPDGLGYLSRLPDRGEALQNPHMHLLEAVLALHETAPDASTRRVVEGLCRLFRRHLLDAATGTLGERFDGRWRPLPGPAGDAVEPGHHYEWVWLLHRAERCGFGPDGRAADRLFAFAERFGLVPGSALIHDEVARGGQVLSSAHRSWPQTERIKALVARGEATGRWNAPAVGEALDALWRTYLAPAPVGGWIDHVAADGSPKVSAVPASTLYHLFLAYAELARTAGRLFAEDDTGGSP